MPSITQPAAPCHIPSEPAEEVLLGVDTHKDVHAAAVITVLGAVLDGRSFPATAEGYRQLLSWTRSFGALRRAGVECTGSYGAALARHLRAEGIEVTEVNQPDKAARRRHGKTDAVDAEAAARAVLSGRATATAKTSDGPVEMLRLFKLAKGSAIKSRTQAINQLKSVLVSADSTLRESLAGLSNPPYGAALARHLRAEGIEVTEVNQPDKAARRRHGKTDAVDAEAAARAVLSGRATATAKTSDGPVEMLRLFKLAKGSAIKSRTQAINQLKSVLVSADSTLRESLAGLSNPRLIKRCADLDDLDATGPAAAARHTLRLLARRIRHLT
ncbi:transposase, partial [Streptomyces sp. NPDC051286]|uniref:IS110 family transposase n=1 Tax=Streptomyces sp. NPDC051286 TaxID=3365647 RepID=UPI0037B42A5F